MTDPQLESRLHEAGTHWRAAQPPPAPLELAVRRTRWLPAVAAAAVVALALAATFLATRLGTPEDVTTAASPGGWEAMSASPLSARLQPIMAGWGDAVVIVGGRQDTPCPPNASCARGPLPTLRDGAVYDVSKRTWRPVDPAPVPLDAYGSAVLGDGLYVWITGTDQATPQAFVLDLPSGHWSELPAPPVDAGGFLRLVAAGDRLVGYYNEQGASGAGDLAYVPATKRWEHLPPAPFDTSFDRSMVWTGDRLVLITPGPPPGRDMSGPPFMKAAVLEDDRWRILPAQQTVIFGSTDWSWTGSRIVAATTMTADGGQNNGFGRAYPSGGYLDAGTGRWTELPSAPPAEHRAAIPPAVGGRWVSNGEGLVLDTKADRWLAPGAQPDGAEQDASGAWAAGRLVVWGGAVGVGGPGEPAAPDAHLLASGAVWTPPGD